MPTWRVAIMTGKEVRRREWIALAERIPGNMG